MFYAHFVLSKRGPLARIWLAAHWDKKLTKAHVFETNLEASVETIISPQVKMALRTSGHLLLGVVRIYNRKAKYLLADCNEAFVKIKMAFRPGVVDLPEDGREAPRNQIYLVEEFQDFDAPLPDISEINMTQNLATNQSRLEDITMRDDVPTSFQMDEGFGGGLMGFGKEVDQFSAGDLENMFFKEDNRKLPGTSKEGLFGMDTGGLDGGSSALDDNFMQGPGLFGEGESFLGEAVDKVDEMVMDTTEPVAENQVMSPVGNVQPETETVAAEQPQLETVDTGQLQLDEPPTTVNTDILQEQPPLDEPIQAQHAPEPQEEQQQEVDTTVNRNETTLIANEEEAFALEPLDVTGVKDARIRRKRKLIVDPVIELDGQTMREQLKNFEDIVTSLDMAPPTKRLMQWKEIGGVDKLFSGPTGIYAQILNKAFIANLHCDVPDNLKDLSATQLNKRYGALDETPTPSEIDESSIHVARDMSTMNPMMPPPVMDESNILENKQLDATLAPPSLPDVGLQPPAAYNSDVDDYEPYSVGPPSPGSSPGSMMAPPSPPKAPGQESALENLVLSDISGIPTGGDEQEPEPEPEPEPEIEESESYAEDVDDLRWNKRTQQLIHTFNRSFKHVEQLSYFQMTEGTTRKQAASKFYSLLVLAKQEACLLHQSESFSDIFIKKGPRFESVLM